MNARSVTNEASRNEAPTTPPPVARKSQSGMDSDRAGEDRRLPRERHGSHERDEEHDGPSTGTT
jgi:hypothetical protein